MRRLLAFFILCFALAPASHAQLWSGIINSTRAVDWGDYVGIPGGLPDGSWTQCGSTISAYSGTAAAINNALASCGTNHYLQLGSGTFNLSTGICFPQETAGHKVLRGSGANQTFLVFTGGASACSGCNGGQFICASSSDGTYRGEPLNSVTLYNWTSGYSQGVTQITLSGVSGIVANQTMLVLTQCDTGFSGSTCSSGSPIDNNGYFICATPWTSAGVGCNVANESADGPSWLGGPDWQQEYVLVTAINQGGCGSTCVTISRPLMHPNWTSSQNPQAIVIQMLQQDGVENLSYDGTNQQGVGVGINFNNCYQCWASGVRGTNIYANGVNLFQSVNNLVQNSYFYGNPSSYGDNAAMHANGGGNNLYQNNICHQTEGCYFPDGPDNGSVVAYNFAVAAYAGASGANGNMNASGEPHAGPSNDYILYEGNFFPRTVDDADHGGHMDHTFFRNFQIGWASCANGQCGSSTSKNSATNPLDEEYASRYANIIANVLGTPGYHTTYYDNSRFGVGVIYEFGGAYGSQPADLLVMPRPSDTAMAWGNYDVVTGAVRWCGNSSDTGWSSTCGSTSEIATSAPTYPNSVPTKGDTGAGQGALPASFYLPSEPAWFGSVPWPAVGPDVTGGNVGQCSGALNTPGAYNGLAWTQSQSGCSLSSGWAGHVNAIPAMACYIQMGGVPDGTGPELTFNPSSCYGGGGGGGGTANLACNPQSLPFIEQSVGIDATPPLTVTCTNSGTAPYTFTSAAIGGTNPTSFSQTNNCPNVLGVGSNCTFNMTFNPQSTGSLSASLTITGSVTTPAIPLSGTGINGLFGYASTSTPVTFSGSSTVQISLSPAPATGDVVEVSTNYFGSPLAITSIKDAFGNSFTICGPNLTQPSASATAIGYLLSAPSTFANPITITYSGTEPAGEITANAFSIASGYTAQLDSCTPGSGTSATSLNTPSVTPSVASELFISSVNADNQVTAITTPPWIQNPNQLLGGSSPVPANGTAEEFDLSVSSTIAAGYTQSPAGNYNTELLAIKATSSSGPSISNLSVTSGKTGTTLNINGSNFGGSQGSNTAQIGNIALTVNTWSVTQINVTIPSTALTGNITVTVSGTTSNGIAFTVNPNISSLSPPSGAAGQQIVTIWGTGFGPAQGTSTIDFGGTNPASNTWSTTSITVTVPCNAVTGNVSITVAGNTSNTSSFIVQPYISNINPASGVPGTSVTLTGCFGTSPTVTFSSSVPASVQSSSNTTIITSIPTGAVTGNVTVTSNSQVSNGYSETVNSPSSNPVLTSVTPGGGLTGQPITVGGSNFTCNTGSSVNFIGTTTISVTSFTSCSSTSIVLNIPVLPTGTIYIQVVTSASLDSNEYGPFTNSAATYMNFQGGKVVGGTIQP